MSAQSRQLNEVVREQIQERTGRRVQDLTVEVAGEVVVLRGRAKTFHVKQLAQRGVRDVLPLAQLQNAIVVN